MKRISVLFIIIILLLSITACSKRTQGNAGNTAFPDAKNKNTVEAFGIVKVYETRNVIVDISAGILAVNVKEGQKVKLNDVLIDLDLQEFQFQKEAKEAQLKALHKEIKNLKSYISSASDSNSDSNIDPELRKLQNDLKYLEDAYEEAKKELLDKQSEYIACILTEKEYEEFEQTLETKKKDIEDMILVIEAKKRDKEKVLNEKLIMADSLQRELAVMNNKLNKGFFKGGKIVSDINNGLVFDIGYVPGEITSLNKKLLSIANLDTMYVEANIPEEFIKDIKLNAKTTIRPLADKTKVYQGRISRISNMASATAGETSITIDIEVENKDDFMLPNCNMDLEIDTK